MNVTLNLFTTALETDGRTVATARKTPKGWYWFSNVGRNGRKMDFPTKEVALRAAAKTLGLDINEVILDGDE
jgi:hypothetical protein